MTTATEYETRLRSLIVLPVGAEIFSEKAIIVEIDDESCGEFVVIRQPRNDERGEIRITAEEWPTIREAIDRLVKECRS